MHERPVPYRKTVFVCTNRREAGERICCAAGEGEAIRDTLKTLVKERKLANRIRVCKSGCMDLCELGPNVMIWPDNLCLHGVTLADVPAILDRLTTSMDGEPS